MTIYTRGVNLVNPVRASAGSHSNQSGATPEVFSTRIYSLHLTIYVLPVINYSLYLTIYSLLMNMYGQHLTIYSLYVMIYSLQVTIQRLYVCDHDHL